MSKSPKTQIRTSAKIVGALVAIPVGDRWRLAKVIFASNYVRDAIAIKLLDMVLDDPGEASAIVGDPVFRIYYTSVDPIRVGRWQIVGYEAVSEAERRLTHRTSGGEIWVEDQHLGPASDEDLATLPKMLIHGFKLVEKYAAAVWTEG